ncbi:Methylthioribose kinase [compost metagenome]
MFAAPGYQDYFLANLLRDTVGFAGAKMVRRVVGLAHVADIDKIEDAAARERAQRLALTIGTAAIRANRQVTSIDELIHIATRAAERGFVL